MSTRRPASAAGHEVRERLARSGTRLGDERAAAVEGARDRGGQRALSVTRFEVIDGRGERPVDVEDAIDARGQRARAG